MTPRQIIEHEARLGEKFRRTPRTVADEVMRELRDAGYLIVERPKLTVGPLTTKWGAFGGSEYRLAGIVGDERMDATQIVTGLVEREHNDDRALVEYVKRTVRHDYLLALGERLGLA